MSAKGGSASGGKKIFLGTLMLVFALTLSACGNKTQTQEKEMAKEMAGEKSGMISSIKDAMGMKKKMKCTYKIKAGGEEMESISYIDGEKYRAESKVMGKKHIAIFDGSDMHSWSEGQKTGMKMTKKCTEELQAQNREMNQGEEKQNQEEFQAGAENFDNAIDVKCEEVSDIDFSIPTDVEFVDQCEMIKGLSEQMKNMNVPIGAGQGAGAGNGAGANMPNIPNMPELQ